jgi:HSP20 family protein
MIAMSGVAKSLAETRQGRRGLSPFPELMDVQRLLSELPFWGVEQTSTNWQPAVDIFEAEDELVITMDLPGIKKEDVQVNLDDRTLTIRGERRLEHDDKRDNYHRIERTYGQFGRSFTIPPNVNREALHAEYTDGVLSLYLPKLEQAKPRQIPVG